MVGNSTEYATITAGDPIDRCPSLDVCLSQFWIFQPFLIFSLSTFLFDVLSVFVWSFCILGDPSFLVPF